jgi:hypothetical protein
MLSTDADFARLTFVQESRDKALSLPKFNIMAVYELPRRLDCFLIVSTFEELRV